MVRGFDIVSTPRLFIDCNFSILLSWVAKRPFPVVKRTLLVEKLFIAVYSLQTKTIVFPAVLDLFLRRSNGSNDWNFGLSNNWAINYATTGKKEEFDETKAVHLSVLY